MSEELKLSSASSPVCFVCEWRGDTIRFIEAEIDGKSVSLPWRDRPDGLKELVVDGSAAPVVTDEMVERACAAHVQWHDEATYNDKPAHEYRRGQMRAALTAALAGDEK